MIALGAMAERARIGPMLIFVFVWSTIVYDPIACWTWNPNGWSYRLHGLDSAGGTPVHITSGAAALAISIYIGKRVGYNTHELEYLPHNTSYVLLGTALLWFGWFGFNGGSGLSANMRAANAIIVTNLSASVGGLTWMAWDWRVYRKWSAVSFCSGAIAGLVAITPACGYVGSPAAVIFGVVSGTACNFGTQLKYLLYIDECLDIFASHVVGGIVGNLLTGIFAQRSIAAYDGFTDIRGGWLARRQSGRVRVSFCITTAILWIMDVIPGLNIRLSEEAERQGVDESQQGEYIYDYVEREREILPSIRYPQHQVASLRHRSMWTTQTDVGQDFVTARGDTGTIDDTGPREPMLEMVTVNEAGPSNWNGRAV
ncbi:ammonium transporter AmtB-like domain-containing protein [Auriculariales sp. MPI-PUGE-AT-0066]|nr:ammonium transporter AmtB-like domain-containing protein [Auriculariales sp. MPI-PUGE-AT-0066]